MQSHNLQRRKFPREQQRLTNPITFPQSVKHSPKLVINHEPHTGLMGKIWFHGPPWYYCVPEIQRTFSRIFTSHSRNGGTVSSFRLSSTFIWSPFQFMRKPDPPSWNRGTETEIPARSCLWEESWKFGHERIWKRQ
jgi:hypothetical protein